MTTTTIQLPAGPVEVRDEGTGPPVVLLHGLLVGGTLWRDVTPHLNDAGLRTIVPELPLGAHRTPMNPDADLTPPGLARIVADLLEAMGLDDVTLVANDTGGAIAQLVATTHPERLGRLVLTSCDCFENFLPPIFMPMIWAGGHIPGAIVALTLPMRSARLRRSPAGFGWLAKRPIPDDVSAAWLAPLADRHIRRDLRKVMRGVDKRHTIGAAEDLRRFDRPALLAWAADDRFFPLAHAYALAERIPDARVEEVVDSYTFVPQDQPERLAELVRGFVNPTSPTSADASRHSAPASSR
jgi:pimeloyl-ACP methyl ester carboxylesterase